MKSPEKRASDWRGSGQNPIKYYGWIAILFRGEGGRCGGISFKASVVASKRRVGIFRTAVNTSLYAAAATSLSPTLLKIPTRRFALASKIFFVRWFDYLVNLNINFIILSATFP